MNPSDSRQHGEVVKLGPPASGEVTITVDPALAGTSFSAGTQTLLPGAQTPVHRHLDRDMVLFAYRGQGRATVNDQATVVVPGTALFVPRSAWYGLRNTGTGTLQVGWVAAPPGLEAFYRDLSGLGGSPAEAAMQELGQRHRVEFRTSGATPTTDAPRRHGARGGRRGRGRRGGGSFPSPGPRASAPTAPVEPSAVQAASPPPGPTPAVASTEVTAPSSAPSAASGGARHRHRGRRRGGRRSGAATSGQGQQARPAQGSAPASAPTPSSPHTGPRRRQSTGAPRPAHGRHRRRVKEVYMDGRWVQVEGEAPVIAPSPQRRHRSKQRGDDEPPAVPFSVPI